MSLPFSAQSHILEKYDIGSRGDYTRIFQVNLKVFNAEYALINDNLEFETTLGVLRGKDQGLYTIQVHICTSKHSEVSRWHYTKYISSSNNLL